MESKKKYKIESGITPPEYSGLSYWTTLALEMGINDSVVVDDYEAASKLRGAISRIGFGSRRLRLATGKTRVWKVEVTPRATIPWKKMRAVAKVKAKP